MTLDPNKPSPPPDPAKAKPAETPPAQAETAETPPAKVDPPPRTAVDIGDNEIDMTADELKRYAARGYRADHVEKGQHDRRLAELESKAKVADLLNNIKMADPARFQKIRGLIAGDVVPTGTPEEDHRDDPADPPRQPAQLSPEVLARLSRVESQTAEAVSRLAETETSGVIASVIGKRPAIVGNADARQMVEQEARNLVQAGIDPQAAALRAATRMERLLASAAQGVVDQRTKQQQTMKPAPLTATPGLTAGEKPPTVKDLRDGTLRKNLAAQFERFKRGELFGNPPQ
jgi:hypothetical protein